MSLIAGDVARLAECIGSSGVAVIPTDTVYGLACDPADSKAVERLNALKGRDAGKPSAVLYYSLNSLLEEFSDLGPRTESALAALLPGPVLVVIEDRRRRFPLASGEASNTVGLRAPELVGPLESMGAYAGPLLQSSANFAGGRDPRSVDEIPADIRAAADLVLDYGPLGGVASTVVDLLNYEKDLSWRLLREGAVPSDRIAAALQRDRFG